MYQFVRDSLKELETQVKHGINGFIQNGAENLVGNCQDPDFKFSTIFSTHIRKERNVCFFVKFSMLCTAQSNFLAGLPLQAKNSFLHPIYLTLNEKSMIQPMIRQMQPSENLDCTISRIFSNIKNNFFPIICVNYSIFA